MICLCTDWLHVSIQFVRWANFDTLFHPQITCRSTEDQPCGHSGLNTWTDADIPAQTLGPNVLKAASPVEHCVESGHLVDPHTRHFQHVGYFVHCRER